MKDASGSADPRPPVPAPGADALQTPFELSTGKRDLVLHSRWVNAAGFLGVAGEARELVDLAQLGALITSPLSLLPRSSAHGPRLLAFPGGFLLRTRHPNPGLHVAVRRHETAWSALPIPVIVHLLPRTTEEAAEMVTMLESIEACAGLELGLGEVEADQAADLVAACAGVIPVIAQLPLGAPAAVFAAAAEAGAQAVSVGAPRGALPGQAGSPVRGRLYGPAVFPFALQAVAALRETVRLPIFAGGGVYGRRHARALLGAGADVVVLDGVFWTEPESVLRYRMTD
jgi:dihydroorotate dehydrogenase (NAD+) catalytic subunit